MLLALAIVNFISGFLNLAVDNNLIGLFNLLVAVYCVYAHCEGN